MASARRRKCWNGYSLLIGFCAVAWAVPDLCGAACEGRGGKEGVARDEVQCVQVVRLSVRSTGGTVLDGFSFLQSTYVWNVVANLLIANGWRVLSA